MVAGLGSAFKKLGNEVNVFRQPITDNALEILVNEYNPDIVIQINKFRPKNLNKKKFRHISWFQDVFPSTVNTLPNTFKDGDIVYTLGNKESLGLGKLKNVMESCLVTGVDPIIVNETYKNSFQQIDCSLCGFIPDIPKINTKRSAYVRWTVKNMLRKIPLLRSIKLLKLFLNILGSTFPRELLHDMMSVVEKNYDNLSGNLEIEKISKKLIKITQNYCHYIPSRSKLDFSTKRIEKFQFK